MYSFSHFDTTKFNSVKLQRYHIGDVQLDSALPGAHAKYQSKVDMLATFRYILVTEELNDLEQLFDMKILGTCNDINHTIEVIGLILQQGRSVKS